MKKETEHILSLSEEELIDSLNHPGQTDDYGAISTLFYKLSLRIEKSTNTIVSLSSDLINQTKSLISYNKKLENLTIALFIAAAITLVFTGVLIYQGIKLENKISEIMSIPTGKYNSKENQSEKTINDCKTTKDSIKIITKNKITKAP